MSVLLAGGPDIGFSVFAHGYTSVWVKFAWADDWYWLPYVRCVQAEASLWPNIPRADFRYESGWILREDKSVAEVYSPYELRGAYIKVMGHDYDGDFDLWYGVVEVEKHDMHSSDFLQGDHVFTAFGMERLLERVEIAQHYTEDGVVDRRLVFNGGRGTSGTLLGLNRSTDPVDASDPPLYYFSAADGAAWTRLDIVYYLLYGYAPKGVTWVVDDNALLDEGPVERFDFTGKNLFQALNQLFDRRRGIGCRVWCSGSTVYISTGLLSDVAIAYEGIVDNVPLHPEFHVELNGIGVAGSSVSMTELSRYHGVWVRGNPMRTCFTARIGSDEALKEGWSTALEDDYKQALDTYDEDEEEWVSGGVENNDSYRSALKFEDVYTKFLFNESWDAGSINPEINAAGELTFGGNPPIYFGEKVMDSFVPFLNDDGAVGEYQRPFAVIEFTVGKDSLGADVDHYLYTHKLDVIDKFPARIGRLQQEFGIRLRAWGPNHVAAESHFDMTVDGVGRSAQGPVWNFEDLYITLMFPTDRRVQVWGSVEDGFADLPIGGSVEIGELGEVSPEALKVIAGLHTPEPSQYPPATTVWDSGDEVQVGEANSLYTGERYRWKIIDVPDAELWLVAGSTISKITDGDIEYYDVATNGYPRDDRDRLRYILGLALAHYSRKRASLKFDLHYLHPGYGPGLFITGAWWGEQFAVINTPVSKVTLNFDKQRTTVETNHVDLEFGAVV